MNELMKIVSSLYGFAVLDHGKNLLKLLGLIKDSFSSKIVKVTGEGLIDLLNCMMILQHKLSNIDKIKKTLVRTHINQLLLHVLNGAEKFQTKKDRAMTECEIYSQLTSSYQNDFMLPKGDVTDVTVGNPADMMVNSQALIGGPLDLAVFNYVLKTTAKLVDETSLFFYRVENVKKIFPSKNSREIVKRLPHRITPYNIQKIDERVHKVMKRNEKGFLSGIYGWCVSCRKTAVIYCLETNSSFCSRKCNKQFIEDIRNMEFLFQEKKNDFMEPDHDYTRDARKIMNYLVRIGFKDDNKQKKSKSQKLTLNYTLELLYMMLKNCGTGMITSSTFNRNLQERILPKLIKLILYDSKTLFSMLSKIIWVLIEKFRGPLKSNIAILINDALIPLVMCPSTRAYLKKEIIWIFSEILNSKEIVRELYINYDCDFMFPNCLKNILQTLINFVQESYLTSKFVVMSQEEMRQIQYYSVCACSSFLVTLKEGIFEVDDFFGDDSVEIDYENMKNYELEVIHKKKRTKQFAEAIKVFNKEIKDGLKILSEHRFLSDENPLRMARFLFKYRHVLSKERVGEFFGKSDEFNQSVLKEYLRFIDMKDKSLDEALRVYLSYFDMPGEAQMVDRIINSFSLQYSHSNPKTLDYDTAYSLSFLLMMLQTDAHNPNVEEKMTFEGFKRLGVSIKFQNKPIEEGMLKKFYKGITAEPLSVHHTQYRESQIKKLGQSNEEERRKIREQDMKRIITDAMTSARINNSHSKFVAINKSEYFKQIFEEGIWDQFLPVLSLVIQGVEHKNMIGEAIKGLANLTLLCASYNQYQTQNTATFNAILNFTGFFRETEFKVKNIQSTNTILRMINTHPNLIRNQWNQIVSLLSRIDRLRIISQRSSKDLNNMESGTEDEGRLAALRNSRIGHFMNLEKERKNAILLFKFIKYDDVEQVFSNSVNLNDENLQLILESLIAISQTEIQDPLISRMFCIDQFLEVVRLNCFRNQFDWMNVWNSYYNHIKDLYNLSNLTNHEIYLFDTLQRLATSLMNRNEKDIKDYQKLILKGFTDNILDNQDQESQDNNIAGFRIIKSHPMHITLYRTIYKILKSLKVPLTSGWDVLITLLDHTFENFSLEKSYMETAYNLIDWMMTNGNTSICPHLDKLDLLVKRYKENKKKPNPGKFMRYSIDSCLCRILLTGIVPSQTKIYLLNKNLDLKSEIYFPFNDREFYESKYFKPEAKITIADYFSSKLVPCLSNLMTYRPDQNTKKFVDCIKYTSLIIEFTKKILDEANWMILLNSNIKPLIDDINFNCDNFDKLPKGSLKAISSMGQSFLIGIFNSLHDTGIKKVFKTMFQTILHCIEVKLQDENLSSLLHILSALNMIYDQCFAYIDYTHRDKLLDINLRLLNFINQRLRGLRNIKFQLIDDFSENLVFTLIDVFQRDIDLLCRPIIRSYKFLTEEQKEEIFRTIKILLQYCENFDSGISEKIVYYKNLFYKTTSNLQSLRLARRLLKRAQLLMIFKKLEQTKSPEDSKFCIDYMIETVSKFNTRYSSFMTKKEKNSSSIQENISPMTKIISIENLDRITISEEEEEISMYKDIIFSDFIHVTKAILTIEKRKLVIASLFKELVELSSILTGFNLKGLVCGGCRLCTDCLKIGKGIEVPDLVQIFDQMAAILGN